MSPSAASLPVGTGGQQLQPPPAPRAPLSFVPISTIIAPSAAAAAPLRLQRAAAAATRPAATGLR